MTTTDTSWLRKAQPWIWTALVAVACVTGTFIFSDKPLYEAHAALELEQPTDQLQLLSSDPLILKAARQVGLQTDSEFNRPASNPALIANVRKHLSWRRDPTSQLVHLAFTSFDAKKSAAFANALIDAYTDEIQSRGLAKAADASDGLSALQASIIASETKLADPASKLTAVEIEALIRETNSSRQLYDAMLLQASAPTVATHLIDRAEIPVEPTTSNPWSGFAVGFPLTLGGGLLFFVSRKRLQQIAEPAAQAEVMCAPDDTDKPVVAVSNAGTGFTNPDTLLAFVDNLLTTTNRSVLLIDCEVRGALTESVGLRGEYGFSDFLMDHSALDGALPAWKTNRDGVSVMPAGSQPFRIPSLLARPNVREALAVLLAKYDRVVINAPAILTTGEMRDLSPLVDGVILVTPRERSMNLAPQAARQVEEFGGKVLGLVEDPNQLVIA